MEPKQSKVDLFVNKAMEMYDLNSRVQLQNILKLSK